MSPSWFWSIFPEVKSSRSYFLIRSKWKFPNHVNWVNIYLSLIVLNMMISLKIWIKILKIGTSTYRYSPSLFTEYSRYQASVDSLGVYFYQGKIEVEMYTAKYIDGDWFHSATDFEKHIPGLEIDTKHLGMWLSTKIHIRSVLKMLKFFGNFVFH